MNNVKTGQIDTIINDPAYADLFKDEIGTMNNAFAKFDIRENAQPVL